MSCLVTINKYSFEAVPLHPKMVYRAFLLMFPTSFEEEVKVNHHIQRECFTSYCFLSDEDYHISDRRDYDNLLTRAKMYDRADVDIENNKIYLHTHDYPDDVHPSCIKDHSINDAK